MADDQAKKVVTPNSAPPVEGETQIVDKSAPADNRVAEVKNGKPNADTEAEKRTAQPGDQKVKTNEGGTVVERDATKADLEDVDARKKPETVTEAEQAEKVEGDDEPAPVDNAFGGENGQRSEDDEAEEGEPTVKLKNPGGRVVEVPASHVAHHKMFAAGFTLVKGEKYPEDIKALDEAYRGSIHARNIYNDVDDSDPQQSMSKGDVERRKGTKKVGESDGEPQARVAAPKNANKPATFDGVDKRENGQVVDPKTNKPLKGNRLAQALKG